MATACLLRSSRGLLYRQIPRISPIRANIRSFSLSSSLLERKYSSDHEWVDVSSDKKTATIGVSKYAADALGEVVYVELPSVDSDFAKADTIGSVESVKSASDIYAPVSGKVVEINAELEDTPSLINSSPEKDAWLAKIELSESAEEDMADLMTAEEYKKHTEEEK